MIKWMHATSTCLPTDDNPELRRNQYGATLGGPIMKNKTFLFGSWQGTRQNSGAGTIVETMDSPAFRAGDFSSVKTAINDPSLTVPNAAGTGFVKPHSRTTSSRRAGSARPRQLLYKDLPLPKTSASGEQLRRQPDHHAQPRSVGPARRSEFLRTPTSSFCATAITCTHFVNPGPLPAPMIGSTNFQQSTNDQSGHGAVLGETHVFGAALVNEFRAGYNRVSNALAPFIKENLYRNTASAIFTCRAGTDRSTHCYHQRLLPTRRGRVSAGPKGSDTFQMNDGADMEQRRALYSGREASIDGCAAAITSGATREAHLASTALSPATRSPIFFWAIPTPRTLQRLRRRHPLQILWRLYQ